jgi:UDP-N-acetylglucosamine acyltransferase
MIEAGAKLAKGVRVGPFSYIGPRVRIGSGCVIENNVTITGETSLGANNHVSPMCVIGAGLNGAAGVCAIGSANSFREHVTVYGGSQDRPTQIGCDNLVMIDSHIGPGARVGDHCIFDNCTNILAGAAIEDYVRASGFAAVEEGVRVGAYTFIAGFTGVDRDAPPFAMLQGYPFRVRSANTRNLKRCGFDDKDIAALKDAFREIFNGTSDTIHTEALDRLAQDPQANPHVLKLIAAVRQASRRDEQ